jgi:hypothetical protein
MATTLAQERGARDLPQSDFPSEQEVQPRAKLTGPKDDMSRIFLSQSHLDARETLAIRGHHQDTLGLSEDTRRLAE